jgi:chloramphenicol O-acetyltransferase type A
MPKYIDIETWHRRQLFEFFIDYKNPYFNVCTKLDVTELLTMVRDRPSVRVSSAIHYFGLRAANEVEPFRYRLQDKKIVVYDVINGGTTVLLPNESFAYAYFDFHTDFETFVAGMNKSVDEIKNDHGPLKPTMRDDVIYHTTLPWISFTSFAHARTPGRGDSVPRFVFGRFTKETGRVMMPFSVEVHHALMDGLHVGRFLARFEEALATPEAFMR